MFGIIQLNSQAFEKWMAFRFLGTSSTIFQSQVQVLTSTIWLDKTKSLFLVVLQHRSSTRLQGFWFFSPTRFKAPKKVLEA